MVKQANKQTEYSQPMTTLMERLATANSNANSSVPKVSKWDTSDVNVATCRVYYSSAVAIVAMRPAADPNKTTVTVHMDHSYATPKLIATFVALIGASIICGAELAHPKTAAGWLITISPLSFLLFPFLTYIKGKRVLSQFIDARLSPRVKSDS